MVISEERLQRALVFLAQTDEECAGLKEGMLRLEYVMDLARRKEFLLAEGNIEERKAKAETSENVKTAAEMYYDSVGRYEKMKAKRATEELIIITWRTLEASRRVGNV